MDSTASKIRKNCQFSFLFWDLLKKFIKPQKTFFSIIFKNPKISRQQFFAVFNTEIVSIFVLNILFTEIISVTTIFIKVLIVLLSTMLLKGQIGFLKIFPEALCHLRGNFPTFFLRHISVHKCINEAQCAVWPHRWPNKDICLFSNDFLGGYFFI